MAPGSQARGIDRQCMETESAAQKALAIGGRHCPPTRRHSNSAEIVARRSLGGAHDINESLYHHRGERKQRLQ
jgi:hypothetical protein